MSSKRFGKTLSSRAALLALATLIGSGSAFAQTWKFGVMSDTQWIGADDGRNPNTVAVGLINQVNAQFVKADVKFVVQVGDLEDVFSPAAMDTRAAAAKALYDAGIGFFPLRGNHESSKDAALYFQTTFPQTQGVGPRVYGASRFTSPFPLLNGLSYSFDYSNARFILLDQFTRTDGSGTTNDNILDQQVWFSAALSGKPRDGHAFVFSHKNLIGQNHTDVLFGADPSANLGGQNAFISSMSANRARYAFSGHDHIHQRSIVTSPDGKSQVQEIIGASDSSKFYIPLGNPEVPGTVNNDIKYNPTPRETSIAQERNTVGYYIVTVSGPCASVDFYSSKAYPTLSSGEYLISQTPTLNFIKQETFGYCLNGQEFLVAQGKPYNVVKDSFGGTSAKILGGMNGSMATDGSGRKFTNAVETGWAPQDRHTASDILYLSGMAYGLGSKQTDVYALSMTYDPQALSPHKLYDGAFGLSAKDEMGVWVNAVDLNAGGSKRFVMGAWDPSFTLGTYGFDPATETAWAVVNYNANFAVAEFTSTVGHGHGKGDGDGD